MRYLDSARNVHQGHTAAVIDVDYAPSGQEFVSGSYDCSLRIFNVEEWRSRFAFLVLLCYCCNWFTFREIYHTPRMQYVLSVLWSLDNKYVLSGSDEMNIRVWKSNAAEKLGPVNYSSFFFSFSWQALVNCLIVETTREDCNAIQPATSRDLQEPSGSQENCDPSPAAEAHLQV